MDTENSRNNSVSLSDGCDCCEMRKLCRRGYDRRLVNLDTEAIQVQHYGEVSVQLDWNILISCAYDRASFPYDQHTCSASFYKTASALSSLSAWQYELRSGTFDQSSIQFLHNAATHKLTANDFELVEYTQDTWYHNFIHRNGSTERPDEMTRKNYVIFEFVRLKVTFKRRAPWFRVLFKAPLLVLLLVTAVAVCSSVKSLAVLLLTANTLLHALLINSFLSVSRFSESLPDYGMYGHNIDFL